MGNYVKLIGKYGSIKDVLKIFKKNNIQPLDKYSLDKLRNIPTTGEPLDEDSWWWLFEKVGNKKIPIMNLSGGTEIGGAMLSVFPGMKLKPSTVGIPVPGMDLDIVDDDGNSVRGKNGYLVIKSPWPAMTGGLLNDNDRYSKHTGLNLKTYGFMVIMYLQMKIICGTCREDLMMSSMYLGTELVQQK